MSHTQVNAIDTLQQHYAAAKEAAQSCKAKANQLKEQFAAIRAQHQEACNKATAARYALSTLFGDNHEESDTSWTEPINLI